MDRRIPARAGERGVRREREELQEEAALARDLGFDAEYLGPSHLSIGRASASRIRPVFSRAATLRESPGVCRTGGRIYEHSAADEFCEDPRAVKAAGHRCASTTSSSPRTIRSWGSPGSRGPRFPDKTRAVHELRDRGTCAEGGDSRRAWWDTGDPYVFLRVEPHQDSDVVIFGGEDHKTGQQEDTVACYRRLERRLAAIVLGWRSRIAGRAR